MGCNPDRYFTQPERDDSAFLGIIFPRNGKLIETHLSSPKPELIQKTNTEENIMLKMNLANLQLSAHKKVEVLT